MYVSPVRTALCDRCLPLPLCKVVQVYSMKRVPEAQRGARAAKYNYLSFERVCGESLAFEKIPQTASSGDFGQRVAFGDYALSLL